MVSPDLLGNLTDGFSGAHVLCLGDALLDRFIYGEVERVSPEAPIPILRIRREEEMLGGAGNVVANIAALGAGATLVALIGEDAAGQTFQDLAAGQPNLNLSVISVASRPTAVKSRYIASQQQMLRTDSEVTAPIDEATAKALLAAYQVALDGADSVILSDYGKGVLSDAVLASAIAHAKDAGKPIIVDPKREDWKIYEGATLITPNRHELARMVRLPTDSDDEIVAAGRQALAEIAIDALLVTRADKGISLIRRNDAPIHIPTRAREVFDVSGAGDTVVATVAAVLAAGGDLAQASALANLAGGIVVGKVGTAVVRRGDLETALRGQRVSSSEAKLANHDQALEVVRQWRAQGLRVGFTNGCFDLLHPGHVSLMRQAADASDRLVVGLNSDASVARLKGPGRPIQDEIARAIVLASLEDVDLVTVFAEDTPIALIRLLEPDVLVKGADYTVDQVVGAEDVIGWGGDVLLAELEPGNSTSQTLRRLRDKQDTA